MYNKAVDNFSHTVKFVPDYFMTQKMCDKAVDRCILYLFLFLIGIKLKKV